MSEEVPPTPPPRPHTVGDAPIEEQYFDKMQVLAGGIDKFLNEDGVRRNGFVLLCFELMTTEGRMNYISNGQPADVLKALKEQVRHFEAQNKAKAAKRRRKR